MASVVKLNAERLADFAAQAKQIQQDCEIHLQYIDRVRNELNWDVPVKAQVAASLDDLYRRVTLQKEKMEAVVAAANMAISESGTADDTLKNRIINLLLSLIASPLIAFLGSTFITGVASYAASLLHNLFGVQKPGTITSVEDLRKWLESIRDSKQHSNSNQSQQPATSAPQPTTPAPQPAVPAPEPAAPASPTLPSALKGFSNSNVAYRGYDYSEYGVVKGFSDQYCYNQNNYKRFVQGGFNYGCTATAEAVAVSSLTGKAYTPNQAGWGANGATWSHCTKTPLLARDTYTADQGYAAIYNKVKEGSPVIVRLKDDGGGGHSVTAVGIRPNCVNGKPSASDILIVDPGDGKVKTLAQVYNGKRKMYMDTSWSLLLPQA